MSEFSECLDIIRQKKNLYVIDLARLMDLDSSTISKWLSGNRKPQTREVLAELISKMKLSESDKNILTETYEMECVGKSNYKCFKLWFEIIKEIHNKKTDFLPDALDYNRTITSLPKTALYENKIEILQAIQNIFNYIIDKKIKKICLRFDIFNPDVMLLLNLLVSKGCECDIELIVFPNNNVVETRLFNLSVLKELISLWARNCSSHIYISENMDEINREENFIITNEFVLQYRQDLSRAHFSTDKSWVDLWNENFESWKSVCRNLCNITSVDNILYRYNYWDSRKSRANISWEFMPCFATVLTKEIVFKYLYDTIPSKEEFMQMLYDTIIVEANDYQLTNYFSLEGIYSFMDTGILSTLPQKPFYRPIELEDRCVLLERYIDMVNKGKIRCYLFKDKKMTIKNTFIEFVLLKEPIMRMSMIDENTLNMKILDITDKEIVQNYQDFIEYMRDCGYIYSQQETVGIMGNILEEYKKMRV